MNTSIQLINTHFYLLNYERRQHISKASQHAVIMNITKNTAIAYKMTPMIANEFNTCIVTTTIKT